MLRHVTIFTDIKKVSKNRNQLNNRMILTQLESESVQDFSQRVNDFILDNYRIYQKSYVYSDGASWIQTLANETGSTFILDKFHMKQALWCCAEGINSHYFSSRPKGFHKSNIHKLGYLLSLSHSKHDIRKYFIENIQDFIEEKKILNIRIKIKDI